MNILHVINTAFVGLTLAKYQKRLGHHAMVVHPITEPIGQMLHAGIQSTIDTELAECIVLSSSMSEHQDAVYRLSAQADIIHVHGAARLLPKLKQHFPEAKLVLSYHGSDVRLGGWKSPRKYWELADLISVSTRDLMMLPHSAPEAIYKPNPVDTEHFSKERGPIPNTMLYIHRESWGGKAFSVAEALARKHKAQLVWFRHDFTVPYVCYPRFLEQYSLYLDLKIAEYMDTSQHPPVQTAHWWHAESLTALQFRSLGGQSVFREERRVGVPDVHQPEGVALKWLELYDSL